MSNYEIGLCKFVIDSRAFPRQLITAEMIQMYGNEAEATNNRFDGNVGNMDFESDFK